MDISKTDAQLALDDVAQAQDKARRVALYKGADALYIVWGLVWTVCFVIQHFLPHKLVRFGSFSTPDSSLVWTPLCLLGIAASVYIFKRHCPVDFPEGKRIGIFWGMLFAYFYLWMFLFSRMIRGHGIQFAQQEMVMIAMGCTVPMFAYVVMGLWCCGTYMTWLGVGITVTTVVGLFLVPSYFYLWMAVTAGGTLIVTGVVTHWLWRRQ